MKPMNTATANSMTKTITAEATADFGFYLAAAGYDRRVIGQSRERGLVFLKTTDQEAAAIKSRFEDVTVR